jgi:hypothetical protein
LKNKLGEDARETKLFVLARQVIEKLLVIERVDRLFRRKA